MWRYQRTYRDKTPVKPQSKGQLKNQFKAEGGQDGAHTTMLAARGPVTRVLLIRDGRNQFSLRAAGSRESLCGAATQEAPLGVAFLL